MTRRAGHHIVAAAAVLLTGAGGAGAQLLTANDAIVIPPVGHMRVEAECSLFAADSFVDLDGHAQRFPGSLDFALGVLRASYSRWRNVALGVEQPYRRSTFDEPGIEASFVAKGIPGVGLFIDWSPAGDQSHRWRPVLRFEYFRSRNESDQVLTVSDGANRYSAVFGLTPTARPGSASWRGGGTLQLMWAPPLEAEGRFFESRLQVEAGRAILHPFGFDLSVFGLVGYRSSTTARQEGMYFHDRTSQGAFAGLRLDWRAAKGAAPEVRLSAVRDVRARNALSGWRTTLSFGGTF
jgi:hypothetical protein